MAALCFNMVSKDACIFPATVHKIFGGEEEEKEVKKKNWSGNCQVILCTHKDNSLQKMQD